MCGPDPARSARRWSWIVLVVVAVAPIGCRGPESFSPSSLIGLTDGSGGAFFAPGSGTGGVEDSGADGGGVDSGGSGGAPEASGGGNGSNMVGGTGGSAADAMPAADAAIDGADAEARMGQSEGPPIDDCNRSHWTASASVAADQRAPHNAIDGDLTTRWNTARNQDGTDWFAVDFGGDVTLSGITLNNTNAFPGDYPGGYAVYESPDGKTFTGPFATGAGALGMTVIRFSPRTVRAVRINQTGSTRSMFWWQIDEFQIDCAM
ncbi:MAG TPA: discoidin domain-containing protein [Polyangia bacterium]|nr:discoidin domain-containing protein [Polyangia bacterium]